MPHLHAESPFPYATFDNMPFTWIQLDDWALIQVSGAEALKYLQSQLTYDLNNMDFKHHVQTAHCDANGKLWGNIYLFKKGDDFFYFQRKSLYLSQFEAIKKYSVFSKVTFSFSKKEVMIGIVGLHARQRLAPHFQQLPDEQTTCVHDACTESTLLYFAQPCERFVIISSPEHAQTLFKQLESSVELQGNSQWLALDIAAGNPIIEMETSAQFIPQSVNLQLLNAISFTKGCYSGQEGVARAKYRGANKRALYWLVGQGQHLPLVGESLELQLDVHWKKTGSVLASVQFQDGAIWVQAVLSNDLEPNSQLRLLNQPESHLVIQPLPYSLS